MNCLFWNMRRFGGHNKKRMVTHVMKNCRADIICLEESKLDGTRLDKLSSLSFNQKFKFLMKKAVGTSGGTLIGYDQVHFNYSDRDIEKYCLLVYLQRKKGWFDPVDSSSIWST